MKAVVDCPYCDKKGYIVVVVQDRKLQATAKKLHKEGASYREIAKKLSIPHPQTVKNLIEAD